MKKFVLMHMGFEKPSTEDMAKWGEWFGSISGATVENIGFMGGREISADGVADLGWDRDSITGLSIVEAEDLDAAQAMAERCPFVTAIRVYELRAH